jgi:YfiH family protein
VSRGDFASLNLGAHVGDAAGAVQENRALLARALELPGEPLWLSQVHGSHVVSAEADATCTGDAIVARSAGLVCVIQTADCLPVLLTDAAGTCVAAAHAGWRGLAGGVLEATIQAMLKATATSARSLIAWLGPAIGVEAFEVGAEVRAAYVAHDERASQAFTPNARGRWQADLVLLARQRLMAAGVTNIHGGGLCTATHSERFFSHRRDGRTGRMGTLIWLA